MLTNFFFFNILPKFIPRISYLFIYLIPLLFLSINSYQKNNIENTLPTKYFESLNSNSVEEKADLYLISTKNGYLHALNKEKKEIWKTYLEQELMSSNLTKIQISNDLYLYPYNEQIYILNNGELIRFDIYIKDLVKKQFLSVEDFTLLGKTKTTIFIIDIENGEILQKIDDDNNLMFSNNKVYIRQKIRRKKTLTVVRVDYILNCVDINDAEKFWSATYSDIIIRKDSENYNNERLFFDYDYIKKIIDGYKNNNLQNSDINDDNIITAYAYFDNSELPNIKIYDKSISPDKINANMNSLDNKINKYNNNKYRRQNILPYNIEEYDIEVNGKNMNKIWKYLINKIILIIIIIILCFITWWILFYKNPKNNEQNKSKKNDNIIFNKFEIHESIINSRAKTISIQHKIITKKNKKKFSYDETKASNQIIKKENNNKDNNININDINIDQKNNSKETKSSIDIKEEKENISTNKESKDVSEEIKKDKNNDENENDFVEENNEKQHPLWGEDDDDDDNEEENVIHDIKNEIKENNNDNDNEELKNIDINKDKKYNRLDSDFQNFEKIGEGGFGVVLKATHKIDKYIYAIKIINISGINNNKQIEDIVKETKKMSSIRDKHIVNYNICWYEDNLGSAEKFFNINKTENKSNIIEDINNKRHNSIKILKQESKIKIDEFKSNYCINFRDDSKLLNNSILSINTNQKFFIILMEYCDGNTLQDLIEKNSKNKTCIKRSIIYNYIRQILKGLKALHKIGIIHSDIKPSNIFIKKVGDSDQIKIGDFGLSFFQNEALKGYTPGYSAPELMNPKGTYNEKIDIYACGIIWYELCACFENGSQRKEALKDLRNYGIIRKDIEMKYKEESILIKRMTNKDYNERVSAEDILKSNVFKDLGNLVNNE